jgi:phage gp36-like protein
VSYATVAQFFQYVPATIADGSFITGTNDSNGNVAAALAVASGKADSYMRGRYNLPITGSVGGGPGVYDPAIVMHVCWIAAYDLMSGRGFNPTAGSDALIERRYYEAVGFPDRPGSGWFPGVQRQAIHPDVTETSTGAPAHPFPQVMSAPPRGWGRNSWGCGNSRGGGL